MKLPLRKLPLFSSTMRNYDVIVLGCGGVGSGALWRLARRGLRVVGLDQFPPAHDRGSSHGRTRIIRKAYFEHSDYVPLVLRAYELWDELQTRRGDRLLHPTGLVQVGPRGGSVIAGVLASAQRFGLAVDELDPSELARRFPMFRSPPDCAGVFERDAGYLRVEECVLAQLDEAVRNGADYYAPTVAAGWKVSQGIAEVTTDRGVFRAPRLVITAGPWAGSLLADIGVPLEVRRKPVYWFEPADDGYDVARGTPAFLFELSGGVFYGFPRIDGRGVKVAQHTGGAAVADPTAVNRDLDPVDCAAVAAFVRDQLPGVTSRLMEHSTCLYTMSPDEHFLVDRHPRHREVVFAAGLSGHGFKFTPALGDALADLCTGDETPQRIRFLAIDRPTLPRI